MCRSCVYLYDKCRFVSEEVLNENKPTNDLLIIFRESFRWIDSYWFVLNRFTLCLGSRFYFTNWHGTSPDSPAVLRHNLRRTGNQGAALLDSPSLTYLYVQVGLQACRGSLVTWVTASRPSYTSCVFFRASTNSRGARRPSDVLRARKTTSTSRTSVWDWRWWASVTMPWARTCPHGTWSKNSSKHPNVWFSCVCYSCKVISG